MAHVLYTFAQNTSLSAQLSLSFQVQLKWHPLCEGWPETHLTNLLPLLNTYNIQRYSGARGGKSAHVPALLQDVLYLTDNIYGQAPCLIHLCVLHTALHMAESW